MVSLTTTCGSCGAKVPVPVRTGPSGAFRVGAVRVVCKGCGTESLTRCVPSLTA